MEFFLGTNDKIHINGLSKRLKISVSTAQSYLAEYEKQGVLEKERTANLILYRLKETPFTLELKKTYFLSKISPLVEEFVKENSFVTTLALFGSHAKGTFDKKSDIDLLAIGPQKKVILESLKKLEDKTGKETKIQVFSLSEWKSLLRANDSFALAVIRNNVLLSGDPL